VEIEFVAEGGDVLAASGDEVVDTAHLFAVGDQSVGKRRTDESGDAGDEILGHESLIRF